MNVKEAIEYLINRLQNKATCGRLTPTERTAVNVLRKYIEEKEDELISTIYQATDSK